MPVLCLVLSLPLFAVSVTMCVIVEIEGTHFLVTTKGLAYIKVSMHLSFNSICCIDLARVTCSSSF